MAAGRLHQLGLNLVTPDTDALPGVVTVACPAGQSGLEVAQRLEQAGFLLSCNSDYLRQRNWILIFASWASTRGRSWTGCWGAWPGFAGKRDRRPAFAGCRPDRGAGREGVKTAKFPPI